MNKELLELYQAHVQSLLAKHQELLQKYDYAFAVIPSGELQMIYKDDMSYPFKSVSYTHLTLPTIA